MYSQKKMDFLSGLFLFGLSLVILFYLIPNYVTESSNAELSPRFFPNLAATVLLILSFFLSIISLKQLFYHEKWKGFTVLFTFQTQETPKAGPLLSVIIISIYFLLFEHVGFLIATPPCVALLLLIFGQRRPQRIATISLVLTGVVYVLFTYGLKTILE
ncbi:MAG: tripartite tricarboxylate transporter TctB family protein [Desulfuromonadales bacterium]|nr:tripartite tricarboxylate transporter TctB family protein [Desulfuromonadales bacterium]